MLRQLDYTGRPECRARAQARRKLTGGEVEPYNWYRMLDQKDPHNPIYLSRQIPLLRERLIVLLSGGYDRVDMEALAVASTTRPEVAG